MWKFAWGLAELDRSRRVEEVFSPEGERLSPLSNRRPFHAHAHLASYPSCNVDGDRAFVAPCDRACSGTTDSSRESEPHSSSAQADQRHRTGHPDVANRHLCATRSEPSSTGGILERASSSCSSGSTALP